MIRMQNAVQEDYRLPSAIIPCVPIREEALAPSTCDQRIVFVHAKYGSIAEQYRRIGSQLANRYPSGETFMVTSPAPEDGKTLTALNLALCLAERAPVLLVDLDTRRSTVAEKLGLSTPLRGVEDVLRLRLAPDSCLLSVTGTKLTLAMSHGRGGCDIIDLTGTGQLKYFLEWARQRFCWVVLDTPPVFPIVDTLEISSHAPVGILIVRARKTPAPLIKRSLEALEGRIHYTILNDGETPTYAGYKYDDYYRSSGQSERSI